MKSEVTCIHNAQAELGEGPVWVAEEAALYWVDILGPTIHRYTPEKNETTSWVMPSEIGCLAPREAGGLVIALRDGFAVFDPGNGNVTSMVDPEADKPGNRFNDGKCDPQGRFWAGTMDNAEAEATGSFYRLDENLQWRVMDHNYFITNGPAFSPDGKTAYTTDSAKQIIYAFDMDNDGEISNKLEFIRFSESDGFPDGMNVDTDGGLWVAHWGGARVTRFTPTGQADQVVHVPAPHVTCCAFGGPDWRTLYITTARKGLNDTQKQDYPLSGGLFAVEVDAQGLPPTKFKG